MKLNPQTTGSTSLPEPCHRAHGTPASSQSAPPTNNSHQTQQQRIDRLEDHINELNDRLSKQEAETDRLSRQFSNTKRLYLSEEKNIEKLEDMVARRQGTAATTMAEIEGMKEEADQRASEAMARAQKLSESRGTVVKHRPSVYLEPPEDSVCGCLKYRCLHSSVSGFPSKFCLSTFL